jgi:hypothetical protein
MAVDHRLGMLREAMQRAAVPDGRTVVMAARVTPAFGIGVRELRALDDGAKVPGGRVLPIWINMAETLEIVAWNTGEASDLRKYGNKTHAEAQFFEFIRNKEFDSIEIEISHSPCTACIDMLAGWLRNRRLQGAAFSREPNRRVGNRVYVGSQRTKLPDVQAIIRWGTLYDMPPQATTWQYIGDLHKAGWQLAAPGTALPGGTGDAPVRLL